MPFLVQALLALAAVLALAAAIFFIVRRFGGSSVGKVAGRARQPRLGVIDVASVDSRRRLVIVRRDTVEHLIMIGGPNDVVIESNIVRAQNPMQLREERTTQLSLGDDNDAASAPARPVRDLPAAARTVSRHEPVAPAAAMPEAPGETRRAPTPPLADAIRMPKPAEPLPKGTADRAPADIRPAARSTPPMSRAPVAEAPALRPEPRPRPAVAPPLAVTAPASAAAAIAAPAPQAVPPPLSAAPAATVAAAAPAAAPSVTSAMSAETTRPTQSIASPAVNEPQIMPAATPSMPHPAPEAVATKPSPASAEPPDLEAEMASILGRLSAPPRT